MIKMLLAFPSLLEIIILKTCKLALYDLSSPNVTVLLPVCHDLCYRCQMPLNIYRCCMLSPPAGINKGTISFDKFRGVLVSYKANALLIVSKIVFFFFFYACLLHERYFLQNLIKPFTTRGQHFTSGHMLLCCPARTRLQQSDSKGFFTLRVFNHFGRFKNCKHMNLRELHLIQNSRFLPVDMHITKGHCLALRIQFRYNLTLSRYGKKV